MWSEITKTLNKNKHNNYRDMYIELKQISSYMYYQA